jgi:hypothetical protein
MENQIEIRDDLSIRIGNAVISVASPAEGFRIAEALIRKSARRALAEEAGIDATPERAR